MTRPGNRRHVSPLIAAVRTFCGGPERLTYFRAYSIRWDVPAGLGSRLSWQARRSVGEPAGQDEEGKHGGKGDDTGADQRAAAEAGDEGPVRRVDDHRLGARRRLSRYLEGGRR